MVPDPPMHDTFSISTRSVIKHTKRKDQSVVGRLSSFLTISMPESYQDKMKTKRLSFGVIGL